MCNLCCQHTSASASQQSLVHCKRSALVTGAGQALSGSLTLWNMRSFRRVGSLPAGKVPVSSLAFSPDGLLLAAATHDGMAQLFNAHSREPVSGWPVSSALCSTATEIAVVCAAFDPCIVVATLCS